MAETPLIQLLVSGLGKEVFHLRDYEFSFEQIVGLFILGMHLLCLNLFTFPAPRRSGSGSSSKLLTALD
jgi:hypothetical protein